MRLLYLLPQHIAGGIAVSSPPAHNTHGKRSPKSGTRSLCASRFRRSLISSEFHSTHGVCRHLYIKSRPQSSHGLIPQRRIVVYLSWRYQSQFLQPSQCHLRERNSSVRGCSQDCPESHSKTSNSSRSRAVPLQARLTGRPRFLPTVLSSAMPRHTSTTVSGTSFTSCLLHTVLLTPSDACRQISARKRDHGRSHEGHEC